MRSFNDVPTPVTWGRRIANVGGFVGGAALTAVGGIMIAGGAAAAFTGIGAIPGAGIAAVGYSLTAAGAVTFLGAVVDYGRNLRGQKARHEEYLKTHKSTYADELQYQKDLNRFVKEATRTTMELLEKAGLKYGGVIFDRDLEKKEEVQKMVSSLILESIKDGIHGGKPIGDVDRNERVDTRNPGLRANVAEVTAGLLKGMFAPQGGSPIITRAGRNAISSLEERAKRRQAIADVIAMERGVRARNVADIMRERAGVEEVGVDLRSMQREDRASSLGGSFYALDAPLAARAPVIAGGGDERGQEMVPQQRLLSVPVRDGVARDSQGRRRGADVDAGQYQHQVASRGNGWQQGSSLEEMRAERMRLEQENEEIRADLGLGGRWVGRSVVDGGRVVRR